MLNWFACDGQLAGLITIIIDWLSIIYRLDWELSNRLSITRGEVEILFVS